MFYNNFAIYPVPQVATQIAETMIKTYYKNRLPHLAPVGATFFVTFRLADSLPQTIVRAMREELEARNQELKKDKKHYKKRLYEEYKRYYAKYDHQLDDKPYGECYLRRPEIARIVADKLHEFDGDFYDLHAYCIMPNHVHMLIDTMQQLILPGYSIPNEIPGNYVQLDKIMKRIKGGSARLANLALGRSDTFWQKDSYDHFVRDEQEWRNIIAYILNNPVKAGLVEHWNAWPFTYVKADLLAA